jgi:hypothetical protein
LVRDDREPLESAKGSLALPLAKMPSVAGVYLEQSLDALRDSSSPDALYVELAPWYEGSTILGPIQAKMEAANRRIKFLRASVLFAAIAAEAYANEFAAATLAPSDVAAIDRLPTVDKLLIAPRLAGLVSPLDRGREPIQTLARLVRARNLLAHPRPGQTGAYVLTTSDEDQLAFGPTAVAGYIEAVAHAAVLLTPYVQIGPSPRQRTASGMSGRSCGITLRFSGTTSPQYRNETASR